MGGPASVPRGIVAGMSSSSGRLLADLLDLVLPRRCAGCGAASGTLCAGCRPAGPPLPVGGLEVPVAAAATYAGGLRRALLAYKERDRRDLAAVFGALLAAAVAAVPTAAATGRLVLVPVPSSPAARAARGGDHLRRLAARAGRRTGLRVASQALTLVRVPRDSAGLTVAERAANLARAMAATPAPPGATALVVDDVVTTGTTLAEAVRALRAAGWPVAGAAAVAVTPRRDGRGRVGIGSAQAPGLA